MRYLRAFFTALALTLRGQSAAALKYPALDAWMRQGRTLLDTVYSEAAAAGLDRQARSELLLHLEGRDISMETILGTVQHNLTREYPHLLARDDSYSLLVIRATSTEDHYRIECLAAAPPLQNTPAQAALTALARHLRQPPAG